MTAGRFVLVALLAALLGSAALVPRPATLATEEATLLLAAGSLAHDRDLTYDGADIARFRSRGWAPATRVALEYDVSGRHRFGRPLAYPLLAAPFEAAAPGRGALILNVLLLALAAGLAVRQLTPRMGDAASWLVTAAIFGSAIFGYALAASPASLLVAATVGAFALCWRRGVGGLPSDDFSAPDMYPEALSATDSDPSRRPDVASIGCWLAAGLLLGVIALSHPLFLVLALPLGAGVARRLRAAATSAIAVGALLVLLGAGLTGTLWVEFAVTPKLAIAGDELAELAGRGASPAAAVDRKPVWPPPLSDGQLHLSNLLSLLVGRHIGLLVYFLPVLLLVWLARGSAACAWLLAATAAVLVGLMVLFPFDLAGGGGPGSLWFVPLYAGLWMTPAQRPAPMMPAVLLLLGSLLMAPLWLGRSPAATDPGATLFGRLPFEITQRNVPVAVEVVRRGARVRAASVAIEAAGAAGTMTLRPGGRGQLVVGADRPLQIIALELGPEVKGEAVIAGGTIEHEVFRPDGGVTYRVRPRPARRLTTWWSDERQHVYQLWFSLPATTVPLSFGVSVE